MEEIHFRPAGDRAVLVELPLAPAASLFRVAAEARRIAGAEAAVVGHQSVLVIGDIRIEELHRMMRAVESARETAEGEPPLKTIDVSFDAVHAPDLPLLIEKSGLSRDALIDRIATLELRVRYLGFLPGFPYMEGWPADLALPRRETPRGDVPAGSFAIAGEMAGFYPQRSPGGWNLLGRSDATFWNPELDRPALLEPGDRVRIVPCDRQLREAPAPRAAREPRRPAAIARRAGQWTAVVTPEPLLHRLEVGVPEGGAFDVAAAVTANRAVGNLDGAPVLESAMVGPELEILEDTLLSWCGAQAQVTVGGATVRTPLQFAVSRGDVVNVGRITNGLRGYLARSGGWERPEPRYAPEPRPLRTGELLGGGGELGSPRLMSHHRSESRLVAARAGPHEIGDELRRFLTDQRWTVDQRLDRRGVRLTARRVPPGLPRLLPSAPMIFGTVQWHPDGALVVMGPDHPVTGGYLQPMTLPAAELWKVAQLVPGDEVEWQLGR